MDIKKANAYIGYERISKLYAWGGLWEKLIEFLATYYPLRGANSLILSGRALSQ